MSPGAVPNSLPVDLSSIVQAGVLAPSADNHHCFELQASPDCILLFGNEAYLGAPYHRKILNLISFGTVAENMIIRARRLGYRADLIWLPDAARPSLIAELRLTKGEPTENPLDAAISRRHTNRRIRFGGPTLGEADLAQFSLHLQGIEGVKLAFFDSGTRRAKLLRLIRIAEAERFNTRALHQDLFSSIRVRRWLACIGGRGSSSGGIGRGTGSALGIRAASALAPDECAEAYRSSSRAWFQGGLFAVSPRAPPRSPDHEFADRAGGRVRRQGPRTNMAGGPKPGAGLPALCRRRIARATRVPRSAGVHRRAPAPRLERTHQ